ncbi:MAG: hypothetical protein AAF594_08830 [Bacteroidota bacterium]
MPRLLAFVLLAASGAVWAQPSGAQPAGAVPGVETPRRGVSTVVDSAVVPRGPYDPLPAALAGVVWNAPADPEAAVVDLRAMRRAGVRQVRTGLVESEAVLAEASRLGVALFQDLPVVGLPARFLVRETDAASTLLREALARARPYPAARHFGLARASDTSDPRSRPYFEALTEIARAEGAPDTRTYYVSRFPSDDRADRTVDFVLLDARDADPVDVLRRWRARHETPAGIASFGTGVRPGQEGGWRARGTEAAQARDLEDTLADLVAMAPAPEAAFAYRWRDAPEDAVERDQRAEVEGTRFGLLGEGDRPRAAFDVAAGFWTGTQRTFAFDAGAPAERERRASALLLIGWGLVLGLGVFYAGDPRLGALAPRYFGRRDLYREAVQRGFDLSAAGTVVLGLGLSVATGVAGAAILRALGRTDALVAATASWSPEAQTRLTDLLGQPLVLALVLALAYLTWLVLVLIWLNAMSGRRRLRPAQALSIAVWCRWGWFPLMIVALVLGGIDARLATVLAPALLGVGLFIEIVAGYRMMWDLQAVTSVAPVRAIVVGFGVPFVLAVAGLVWLGVVGRDEAGFLWHLATRS